MHDYILTPLQAWALRAYNSETVYAYGTETDAREYCTRALNVGREINLYAPWEIAPTRIPVPDEAIVDLGLALGDLDGTTDWPGDRTVLAY